MCQVHTGAYGLTTRAPGKKYYTACHPGKTITYILHVRSTYHYAYARQTQVNWKKKNKEKKRRERKGKKRKESEKGKERKDKKSKKGQDKKRKQGKEKRKAQEERDGLVYHTEKAKATV